MRIEAVAKALLERGNLSALEVKSVAAKALQYARPAIPKEVADTFVCATGFATWEDALDVVEPQEKIPDAP